MPPKFSVDALQALAQTVAEKEKALHQAKEKLKRLDREACAKNSTEYKDAVKTRDATQQQRDQAERQLTQVKAQLMQSGSDDKAKASIPEQPDPDLIRNIVKLQDQIDGLTAISKQCPALAEKIQRDIDELLAKLGRLKGLLPMASRPKNTTAAVLAAFQPDPEASLTVVSWFQKINGKDSPANVQVDFAKLPSHETMQALLQDISVRMIGDKPAEAAHLAMQLEIFFQQYSITGEKVKEVARILEAEAIDGAHSSVLLWFKGLVALYGVNESKAINYDLADKFFERATKVFEENLSENINPGSADFIKQTRLEALMRQISNFPETAPVYTRIQTQLILVWESLYGKIVDEKLQYAGFAPGTTRLVDIANPKECLPEAYWLRLTQVQQLLYTCDKKTRQQSDLEASVIPEDEYIPHLTSGCQQANLVDAMRLALFYIKIFNKNKGEDFSPLLKAVQLLRFVATFARMDLRHLSCHQEAPLKAMALIYLQLIDQDVVAKLNSCLQVSEVLLLKLNICLAFSGEESYFDQLMELLVGQPEIILYILSEQYRDLSQQQYHRVQKLLSNDVLLPALVRERLMDLASKKYTLAESARFVLPLVGEPDERLLDEVEIKRTASVKQQWDVNQAEAKTHEDEGAGAGAAAAVVLRRPHRTAKETAAAWRANIAATIWDAGQSDAGLAAGQKSLHINVAAP